MSSVIQRSDLNWFQSIAYNTKIGGSDNLNTLEQLSKSIPEAEILKKVSDAVVKAVESKFADLSDLNQEIKTAQKILNIESPRFSPIPFSPTYSSSIGKT